MDTTIPTPILIQIINKNKESFDDIFCNNTVTDTLTDFSQTLLSSYKETPGFFTHHTYVDFQSITVKIVTDKVDKLVVPSISGNNYLLILFDIDRSSVFSRTIPNRNKHYIKNIYANILKI